MEMFFKYVCYDTSPLNESQTISFFTESDNKEQSVSSMSEGQAVQWLFKNTDFINVFLPDLFDNPYEVKCYFELKKPFTQNNVKPGDIDILLIDTENPEKSIALECKRVKAVSNEDQTAKVNNIEKIKHGVVQANKYRKLGFHQTYLMIILLDDGRNYNTQNIMFRKTKSDQLNQLYNLHLKETLHNEIGVIFVTINQFTGKSIDQNGAIGFCIDRPAVKSLQEKSLTEKIVQLINQNCDI